MLKSKITPIVAATALVVAVFGQTALGQAAGRLVLPKKSVGAVQLKKNAVTSLKVKNGSLLAADFKAGQLPQGPKGDPGAKGDPGPPGPYPDLLPSGKTVRGAYSVSGNAFNAGNAASGSISFGFPLSAPPTPHYIHVGGPPSASCPGNAGLPEAKPGHLCVYEGDRSNVLNWGFSDPVNWYSSTLRSYGIVIWIAANGGGLFRVSGSWAVTAP